MYEPVRFGIDRLAAGEALVPKTARIGLLTNTAARTVGGEWTGDAVRRAGYQVHTFFAPEHGLGLEAAAGESILHGKLGGVPVVSLYGVEWTGAEDAIDALDLVLIDLPDVGVRYYTYPWTMRELLRLAAAAGKPVVVLDRPNPLGGEVVEGNLPEIDAPVCATRVPVRHGLTLGELARRQALDMRVDVDLTIVPCRGWRRSALWRDTGLPWVPPSPALRTEVAALLYPATCLVEGTNVSEGRGTDSPFEQFGAPFLNPAAVFLRLQETPEAEAVRTRPVTFTPESGKFADALCLGLRLEVLDAASCQPVRLGIALIAALKENPEFAFRSEHFDTLAGTSLWRDMLTAGSDPDEIALTFFDDEERFREEREAILLYA
jgi:uncharacterized protein YbbC (DUF1343 family)